MLKTFQCNTSQGKVSDFISKPVKKWKVEDVQSFIESLKFDKMDDKIKKVIIGEKLNGSKILKLTYLKFNRTFKDIPDYEKKKLHYAFFHLRKEKKYNRAWFFVFVKVYKLFPSPNFGRICEIVETFADKKKFFQKYFSFFVEFFEYLMYLKEKRKTKDKKKVSKLEKQIISKKVLLERQYEEMTGEQFMEFAKSQFVRTLERREDWKITCKLIVTDMFQEEDTAKKNFRSFISPFVSMIPSIKANFGLFHTAAIVGPWYLEWTTSELCIPKKSFQSRKAIISHDIPGFKTIDFEDFQGVSDEICNVIFKWNTHMNYGETSSMTKGNCQHFCDELFLHLDIKADSVFSGLLGDFIKKMRTKGKCEMEMQFSPEMRRQFNLKEKKIAFTSHKQLDEFAKFLMDEDFEFTEKYHEEFFLLKSFDRAFWLRYLKEDSTEDVDENLIPLMEDEVVICPFKSPLDTSSFL